MKGPTSTCTTTRPRPTSPPPALAYAEASYDTLSVQFGHAVPTRIPLIVYASHTDFEQTNVLPFTPPEGLLGATDFLKRRVALPFRGNFAEFRHTMRHEMVHVFQLDLLVESYNLAPRASRASTSRSGGREGWPSSGPAGQDARDEMVMRDLTLSGRLPPLKQLDLRHRRHRLSHRRADPPLARRHLRRLAGARSCTRSSTATRASRPPSRPCTAGRSTS